MAVHPDVERTQRALSARRATPLDEGDAAFLDGFLADDVVWHGAGAAVGADISGKANVLARWSAAARSAGHGLVDVSEVYADGTHGAGIVQFTGSGTSAVRQATIFHMNDAGQAAEIWGLPTDHAVIEALSTGNPVAEHPNVAIFRAAEQARQRSTFDDEDVALIKRFLGDDVLWYMGGKSTWVDTQPASLDQVINNFKMFSQATNNTLFFDIHEVFADDVHAASFVTLTADHPRHPERHMNVPEVNIFHYGPDGRVFEFWGIPDDEEARDAFWAEDTPA